MATEEAREPARVNYYELIGRLEAVIAEAKQNPERLAFYFGYFELQKATSRMTDFPSYTLGTVSVSNGDVAIVGDGTIWTGINARAGDTIVIGTDSAIIVDVTDDTNLKIDAWPHTSVVAGTSYKIVWDSPLRYAGAQQMVDVSNLISVLRTSGLLWYLPDGYTAPDGGVGLPALTAEEGQAILKIDTGALWVMTGGAWVSAGTFKGIVFKGAYDTGTAYNINDVITSAGNTYIVIAATTGNAPPMRRTIRCSRARAMRPQ